MDKELERLNAEALAIAESAERLRVELATLRGDAVDVARISDECAVLAFEVKQLRSQLDGQQAQLDTLAERLEKLQPSEPAQPQPGAVVEVVETKADPEPSPQWPTGPTFDLR